MTNKKTNKKNKKKNITMKTPILFILGGLLLGLNSNLMILKFFGKISSSVSIFFFIIGIIQAFCITQLSEPKIEEIFKMFYLCFAIGFFLIPIIIALINL